MDDMLDRSATLSVLMDVGAARKDLDEKIALLGPEFVHQSKDIEDGLKPQLQQLAARAMLNVIAEPTWTNTLYAAVMNTISLGSEDPALLRKFLLQVANITVHWIEILDERNQA